MPTLGQGDRCFLLSTVGTTGTTPVVSKPQWTQYTHIVSLVLSALSTLDGAWLIEASNDVNGPGNGGTEIGQASNSGTWVDVTAGFKTLNGVAIAAVAHGTAATQNQAVQCAPFGFRAFRVTFTPTAGTGNVVATVSGGEY